MLLADDYAGLLTAWKRLLEPSYEVVGTVRDGRALVEAASTLAPDVVIADLSMPEVNGIDACRHIKHAPIAQCTSDALANVRKGTGAIERPLWATSLYDRSWP